MRESQISMIPRDDLRVPRATVEGLDGHEFEDAILTPIWRFIEEIDRAYATDSDPAREYPYDALEAYARSLNSGQRMLLTLRGLEDMVNNGGFGRYFECFGLPAREDLANMRMIGADGYATLLESAMGKFPDGAPPDNWQSRSAINEQIERDAFDQIDSAFYELNERDPLIEYRQRYVEAHPFLFFRD